MARALRRVMRGPGRAFIGKLLLSTVAESQGLCHFCFAKHF
jgi:hypothetical protein